VASLVLGIIGLPVSCGIGSIVAIVLGVIARNQIRASGGRETGDGMAKAGIILGIVSLAFVAFIVVVSALDSTNS
jgi:hypothetical protein